MTTDSPPARQFKGRFHPARSPFPALQAYSGTAISRAFAIQYRFLTIHRNSITTNQRSDPIVAHLIILYLR